MLKNKREVWKLWCKNTNSIFTIIYAVEALHSFRAAISKAYLPLLRESKWYREWAFIWGPDRKRSKIEKFQMLAEIDMCYIISSHPPLVRAPQRANSDFVLNCHTGVTESICPPNRKSNNLNLVTLFVVLYNLQLQCTIYCTLLYFNKFVIRLSSD